MSVSWQHLAVTLAITSLVVPPTQSLAQSKVSIDIAAASVNANDPDACRYRTVHKPPSATVKDSLIVSIFEDTTFSKTAKLPVDLIIDLASQPEIELKRDSTEAKREVGRAGLAERVISVWRAKSTEPLCVFEPFPYRAKGLQGDPFATHTDIMASGEISNALRTGTTDTEATGSLGFHHQSFARQGTPHSYFPFFGLFGSRSKAGRFLRLLSYRVDGEDLRATIGVAGNSEALTASARESYTEAILAPTSAAHGNLGSIDLQYRPYRGYGAHQSVGALFRFAGTRSEWQPDTLIKKSTVVLLAWDVRVHWVVINQQKEGDVNNLQVAFDAGYIYRGVGGDAASDRTVIANAIGTERRNFSGTAVGTYLTLRQVTAFADFMCLSCRPFSKGQKKIATLEGLQPRIGFRFEAPFVTIR